MNARATRPRGTEPYCDRKRTTGVEPATFGLGTDEGVSFCAICERLRGQKTLI